MEKGSLHANAKDLTNKRFGRLTAITYIHKNNALYWKCLCDCGKDTEVLASHLTSGKIKSCGCLRKEVSKKQSLKHGLRRTRLYKEWIGIRYRCNNPKCPAYSRYGGRGIKVCEEWNNDFLAFYNWAKENGYKDNLTIERKDFNKGYSPENCCWIPLEEQARNTSSNRLLEYKGVKKIMAEWAREYNIPYQTFARRIEKGWTVERAINEPIL